MQTLLGVLALLLTSNFSLAQTVNPHEAFTALTSAITRKKEVYGCKLEVKHRQTWEDRNNPSEALTVKITKDNKTLEFAVDTSLRAIMYEFTPAVRMADPKTLIELLGEYENQFGKTQKWLRAILDDENELIQISAWIMSQAKSDSPWALNRIDCNY